MTLIKRLSSTEEALTILVYFGLYSSVLTAVPAYFVWRTWTGDELALLALVGILGPVGQFCRVSAYAAGELMAIAPIDHSRLIFAGIMGFLLFAELPDRYALVGAVIIVGSTLYIAYRETQLSRTHRAAVAARPTDPDRAPRNAKGRIWVYVRVAGGKQPGAGLPLPNSEFPPLDSYIDVAVEGVWNMAPNTRARSSRQRRTGVAIGSMIESSRVVRGSLTSSTMRSTSCSPLRRTSPIGCSPSNMP
jgi:uncharacterized membrane protein